MEEPGDGGQRSETTLVALLAQDLAGQEDHGHGHAHLGHDGIEAPAEQRDRHDGDQLPGGEGAHVAHGAARTAEQHQGQRESEEYAVAGDVAQASEHGGAPVLQPPGERSDVRLGQCPALLLRRQGPREALAREELDANDRRQRRVVDRVADPDRPTRQAPRAAIVLARQPAAGLSEEDSFPHGRAVGRQDGRGDRLGLEHLGGEPLHEVGARLALDDLDMNRAHVVGPSRRAHEEQGEERPEEPDHDCYRSPPEASAAAPPSD